MQNCVKCQRDKAANSKPCRLAHTPMKQQCFEVLCIDLFGPLVTSPNGYRFVLVVDDMASRCLELLALEAATAKVCAGILLDEMLLRYGMCRRLISDNGSQFIWAVLQ